MNDILLYLISPNFLMLLLLLLPLLPLRIKPHPSSVVFAGSVRSGLLTLMDMDRDLDRSTVTIKGKKTGLNQPRPQFSVHGPVLTSPSLNWFKTGLDRFINR